MKFRPTPNLLTGIFMGIFSLTTFNVMAEKAVKPYWQDVQVVEVNKEYPRILCFYPSHFMSLTFS